MEHGRHHDVEERIDGLKRIRDEVQLRCHLLGREGLDLLARIERRIEETERTLRGRGFVGAEIAQTLHELHQSLADLRDRVSAPDRGAS